MDLFIKCSFCFSTKTKPLPNYITIVTLDNLDFNPGMQMTIFSSFGSSSLI